MKDRECVRTWTSIGTPVAVWGPKGMRPESRGGLSFRNMVPSGWCRLSGMVAFLCTHGGQKT